jgi:hypothetical protein
VLLCMVGPAIAQQPVLYHVFEGYLS